MEDMTLGWAWLIWTLGFIGLEGYALWQRPRTGKGGTLSKWTRYALGFTGPIKWLRWGFYGFCSWFIAHIAGWI